MKNFYNIDFDTNTVTMRTWCSELEKEIETTFDLADLRKLDAATNATWLATRTSKSNTGHYLMTKSNKHTLYLHRVVCPCEPGLEVAHLSGEHMDNRRENLQPMNISDHRKMDGARVKAQRQSAA